MDVWSHGERTCDGISKSDTSDKEDRRGKDDVVRHASRRGEGQVLRRTLHARVLGKR